MSGKLSCTVLRRGSGSNSIPLFAYQHAYFRNTLSKHGIIQSMFRKGNSYNNCIMETFFGRLKNEMYYGYEKEYSLYEEFSNAVEKYIDYYNNKRIQAKTKCMPPVKYGILNSHGEKVPL